MALADLEQFLQERAASFDPTLDLTSGSPYDSQVIQPVLRRLGTDPFTVDTGTFIQDRINQQFPGLSTKEGDAITDLLIKISVVLWDPIIRENYRVKQNLSFKDPTTLTLEEADSLGANLFATRNMGDVSKVVARIYFASPQNITISPANFVSTQGGLNFFPTQVQSISVQEMLFNTEAGLYYFDINTIAEQPGSQYNIDPNQLVTIANVGAAVRVTNKLRAQFGNPAEDAPTFVDRISEDLTERSLVTDRGIIAVIGAQFSGVTRLAVTGFNDPEMKRDIITGGGLGPIKAGGIALRVVPDGQHAISSSFIRIDTTVDLGVDFTVLIGPVGIPVSNTTLTVHNAFQLGSLPIVRDLTVVAVIDAQTLQVKEQVLNYTATGCSWTLRSNEITLSNIPGGILFPNTPTGTVSIVPNQIHIGGMTDVFIRGTAFDAATLIINDVVDDSPLLQGLALTSPGAGVVILTDLILGAGGNYSIGDEKWMALAGAVGLTLQILDTPIAGTYRVLSVTQVSGTSPHLTVTPSPLTVGGDFRWRLLDEIFIDLAEPKETRISGNDLSTIQGLNSVTTASAVDFQELGVSPGDVLRILNGAIVMGDYTVVQVLSPLFTRIQVDRNLPATVSSLQYTIFRPNAAGGIQLPFVRIDSINLLDTSNQPVGSNIPFANPIDIQSNSFANASRGIKADFQDATLGIVSAFFSSGTFADQAGNSLIFEFVGTSLPILTVNFTAPCVNVTEAVTQINTQINLLSSGQFPRIAIPMNPDTGTPRQFGILPVSETVRVNAGGTANAVLFGEGSDGRFSPFTSADIRSASTNFFTLTPTIDVNSDVAQVVDGLQIGFYNLYLPPITGNQHQLYVLFSFNPEVGRRVQVGSRSLGSARCYFLEPTSIEFTASSLFSLTSADGSVVRFMPDPTLTYQRIPALPSGVKPLDGSSAGTSTFTSASSDFILSGVQPQSSGDFSYVGDKLIIDFIPIVGTVALADPVASLALTTLILSLNESPDKTITFITDSNSIPSTAVTRAGVASQINNAVGQTICTIDGSNHLRFNPTVALTIRQTGTANALLGFSTSVDSPNGANNKGEYTIIAVPSPTTLTVNPSLFFTEANEQFTIQRVGVQRIISTTMAAQVTETGLYYVDVELVSQGTGDQYNIQAAQQLVASGFKSDGYYLTTDDSTLTFSSVEKPKLHISPTILEIGVNDDPSNATVIEGQNIQINYDATVLTGSVQNFVSSETERVVNANPLARHLIPYFVRADIGYVGGSQPSVVLPTLNTLILGLFPNDKLAVSDVEKVLLSAGATSINNPIDLLAVIHNFDRSVTMERSQNALNTGRLAAFLPDVINLKQSVS